LTVETKLPATTGPAAQQAEQPAAPGRIASLLAYLLVLVGPLLVLLFGRKNKFTLYHACQALGLLFVAVVVPALWFGIGWIFAFLSVQAPWLYIVPIGLALLLPVLQRRQKAVRYAESNSWVGILLTLVVAVVLIYGCWLVLQFLAPFVLPLGGPLLLMAGFSVVIAAYIGLAVAWVIGMINALRAAWKPVPLFGGWGERLYARLAGE
jgi:uncharacterized membrane protein